MIVFKLNTETTFSVTYRTEIEEQLQALDEVTLALTPFNASGNEYNVTGSIESIDCFNRTLFVSATFVDIDRGEYNLRVWSFPTDGDYDLDDYASEDYYVISGNEIDIAVDNTNIVRENERVTDDKGIVTWD